MREKGKERGGEREREREEEKRREDKRRRGESLEWMREGRLRGEKM